MDSTLPPLPTALENVLTSDIVRQIGQCRPQKSSFPCISILLNMLSLEVYNHLYPDRSSGNPAIVFTPTARNIPLAGNIFDVRSKPGIIAASGTITDLMAYCPSTATNVSKRRVKMNRVPTWVDFISPVDIKSEQVDLSYSKIESFCTSVKMYRQDLSRVFGLQGNTRAYRVISLNPGAMEESNWYPWCNSNILIRYLIALYESETNKDTKVLVPVMGSNGLLWKFNDGSISCDIVPFYAASALGRMTWVAIGGQDGVHGMNRVLKVSWLNKARPWNEKDLYDHAHRDGWVPGLARPIHYMKTDDMIPNDQNREKCILILGSTGQPLSECESVFHFLKVMYDLVETHQHMCEKGVLHRDISWGNVLCKPKHDNADKRPVLSRPCIAEILGEANPQSNVLLADLDNGARTSETDTRTGTREGASYGDAADLPHQAELRKRTGTPLFMAMDIASAAPFVLQIVDPQPIFDAVARGNRHYIDVAFPDGDEGFIDRFKRVCKAELARPRSSLMKRGSVNDDKQPGSQIKWPVQHQPRHDVESVYWIIVWWLGRAQPVSSKEKSKEEATDELREKTFQLFCTNLLKYQVGTGTEVQLRGIYRSMLAADWAQILHPGIAFLGTMLEHMGQYLSMDWDLHGSLVGEFHAHSAFKRLILNELINLKDGNPIKISSKPRKFDADLFKEASSSLSPPLFTSGNALKRYNGNSGKKRQSKRARKSEWLDEGVGEKDRHGNGEGRSDGDCTEDECEAMQAAEMPELIEIDVFRRMVIEGRGRWFFRN